MGGKDKDYGPSGGGTRIKVANPVTA